MRKATTMTMLLLPALLLAAWVPTAAADHCAVETGARGYVCQGEEWCDNHGTCGIPICVDDTERLCVNGPPEGYPEDCVLTPTTSLGLVCFGEEWCTTEMCGVPVCLTHQRNVCVNEAP